jgi:hypothetical protein
MVKAVKKTTLKAKKKADNSAPKAQKKASPKAKKKAEPKQKHRGIIPPKNAMMIPGTPGPPMSDAGIEAFQFLTGLKPVKGKMMGGVPWSCSRCGEASPLQCWMCGFVPNFWYRK